MANPISIFKGATGLNTVSDPTRIQFNAESALSDLGVAVNIEIDQSYQVDRRKGYEKLQSGNFHSLFCDAGECLVIRGSSMYTVGTDYSLTEVVTGLTENKRMSYAQHGQKIFYNNPDNLGVIIDGVYHAWEKGTYHGPTTNKQWTGPLNGIHIAIISGRMLIADGPMVWWSKLYDFSLYDIANDHVTFDSNIRMIKPVSSGVFVSSQFKTYFLRGLSPYEWKAEVIAEFPAIEWSDSIKLVDGVDIGLQVSGLCAIWASPEGVILGLPTGSILNLNKDKVVYPETPTTGAGCLIGYNFLHRMV